VVEKIVKNHTRLGFLDRFRDLSLMKRFFILAMKSFSLSTLGLKSVFAILLLAAGNTFSAGLPESAKIDEILARHWQKQGVTPNTAATDEVFLRRIYVDVVGRIPTLEEATAFLNSQDPAKRGKLIDSLLGSPGYASRQFHFFADLLRLLTDSRDSIAGQAYSEWLKKALNENRPYDQMVRELLTTEGGVWDSGAIGFYMRDRGMPLDHLAATVQVFLGTRIECAQCHNHPFDKWTQMDYFKMAAFTYGMDTRGDYGFQKKDFMTAGKKGRMDAEMREDLKMTREKLGEVMKPLRYTQISVTDKLPKLPHDYQYSDAKPGDTVMPAVMFGHARSPEDGEDRLRTFAEWMTNPENPRFTTVIANRLWKQVMGAGLIEPVDEMMDSTVPVNAELMSYLSDLMVAKGYNLKSFLRVLYNSEVYQRMPSSKGVMLGEAYHFPGPLLRRMSAEQVWDSMVTLRSGNVDASVLETNEANEARIAALESLYDAVSGKEPMEIVASVKASAGGTESSSKRIQELTRQAGEARQAGDLAKAKALSSEVNKLRSQVRDEAFVSILGEEGAEAFEQEMKMSGKKAKTKSKPVMTKKNVPREELRKMMAEGMTRQQIREKMEAEFKQSKTTRLTLSNLTRASELPSPAPPGHFLRLFGQSDRETIDNANKEAAVPQALNLMNGPMAGALMGSDSVFSRNVAAAPRMEEKLDTIFLSLLTRRPTSNERQLLMGVAAERGDRAVEDVIHAVLNTGEFLFVR